MKVVPVREIMEQSKLAYLDPAIELIKQRVDDLESRTYTEEEYKEVAEEIVELDKSFDLLCNLSKGRQIALYEWDLRILTKANMI